jgi:hypothetical protein
LQGVREVTAKQAKTIELLRRGWLTALASAQQGGYLSLSQRCGQWRDGGGPLKPGEQIKDKWLRTGSGARVKAYRIVRATAWTA